MDNEIAAYATSIERRLRLICNSLDGMDADALSRRPAPDANSAWVIATHTIGNARAWVLGIAAAQPMRRDRPAEFASTGNDTARVRAAVDAFCDDMAAALAKMSPADLDRRLLPAAELWGEGEPHEISVRDAFVHVIEHASLHLGHLEVTRQLITQA